MTESVKTIVCGKYENIVAIESGTFRRKRIRLGSKNPKRMEEIDFHPISTNGQCIYTERGFLGIRDFFSELSDLQKKSLITLTRRERDFLLEVRNEFSARILVFEDLYPFFRKIKYNSSPQKNYQHLKRLLDEVVRLSFKGRSAAQFLSMQHQYRIERKLRFKTNLDAFFAFASLNPYQEVFKLKEERPERVVVALDFNSMFAECMKGDFLSPKNIRFINSQSKELNIDELPHGLFHVVLKSPKPGFFRNFHPFKYVRLGQSYYFDLESNQQIELLAFRNEIEYYKRFFDSVEVLEGFCSDSTADHPLIHEALEIFKERRNPTLPQHLKDYAKFRLVTMHSATNPKLIRRRRFATIQEVVSFLSSEYLLHFPENVSTEEIMTLINKISAFSIYRSPRGFHLSAPRFDSTRSIFSISTQIIANSKIKLLQALEIFLRYKSVEICYANVDSIHLSIEASELDSFLKCNSSLIHQDMGGMKIEAIAKRGYWFDVGRYWLCDDQGIVKFRNIGFRTKSSKNAFERLSKSWLTYRGERLRFSFPIYKDISNSFSYSKKASAEEGRDEWNFKRYSIDEVFDLDVANKSYCAEVLKSKGVKLALFDYLAAKRF